MMEGVTEANKPFILMTRLILVGMLGLLGVLVNVAWRNRNMSKKKEAI